VSQDGSSLFCGLGTALAATEEQAGEEEAAKPKGASVGALSVAKAGTTAERASRARVVTKVFIPSTSWLSGWQESQARLIRKKAIFAPSSQLSIRLPTVVLVLVLVLALASIAQAAPPEG
jgi:hypothetical protein